MAMKLNTKTVKKITNLHITVLTQTTKTRKRIDLIGSFNPKQALWNTELVEILLGKWLFNFDVGEVSFHCFPPLFLFL